VVLRGGVPPTDLGSHPETLASAEASVRTGGVPFRRECGGGGCANNLYQTCLSRATRARDDHVMLVCPTHPPLHPPQHYCDYVITNLEHSHQSRSVRISLRGWQPPPLRASSAAPPLLAPPAAAGLLLLVLPLASMRERDVFLLFCLSLESRALLLMPRHHTSLVLPGCYFCKLSPVPAPFVSSSSFLVTAAI